MKKQDYAPLDSYIRSAIRSGSTSNREIMLDAAVKRRAAVHAGLSKRYEPERIVDRRLQSMRKLGLIEFNRSSGWTIKGKA